MNEVKGLSEEQIEALVAKGYNRWTTDDGKHDRLYLDVYEHANMFECGKWNGEEIFPACQRAIKVIKVWIDAKTGEVFNHCMMINRYVREYQEYLVDAVKADLESIDRLG